MKTIMLDTLNEVLKTISWQNAYAVNITDVKLEVHEDVNQLNIKFWFVDSNKKNDFFCFQVMITKDKTITFFYEQHTKVFMSLKNFKSEFKDFNLDDYTLVNSVPNGLNYPFILKYKKWNGRVGKTYGEPISKVYRG